MQATDMKARSRCRWQPRRFICSISGLLRSFEAIGVKYKLPSHTRMPRRAAESNAGLIVGQGIHFTPLSLSLSLSPAFGVCAEGLQDV
jgi:hypothetical protein